MGRKALSWHSDAQTAYWVVTTNNKHKVVYEQHKVVFKEHKVVYKEPIVIYEKPEVVA